MRPLLSLAEVITDKNMIELVFLSHKDWEEYQKYSEMVQTFFRKEFGEGRYTFIVKQRSPHSASELKKYFRKTNPLFDIITAKLNLK